MKGGLSFPQNGVGGKLWQNAMNSLIKACHLHARLNLKTTIIYFITKCGACVWIVKFGMGIP